MADDDLFYREMVSSHLESMGFAVVKAHSGWTALRHLQSKGPFVLAVLDIFMGGKSGIEVVELFKKAVDRCDIDDVPIIVMTGDDSQATEFRVRSARASVFLLKPFTKEALIEVVEQLAKDSIDRCPRDL